MAKKKEKKMNVKIDPGGAGFFSDFITVSHNPKNFIVDFQQATPRFTRLGENKPQHTMYVKHNTVILDPNVAKNLLKTLKKNIKKYEEKFGEIKSKKKKKSNKPEHIKSYIG